MLKKILTVTLIVALTMSVSSYAGVFNENKGEIIYTDDFNDKTPGRINSRKENRYISDVFDCPDTVYKGLIGYGYSAVAEDIGPDGSAAVLFEKRMQSRFIVTREMEIGTENKKIYEFSYDIKFSDNEQQIALGCDAARIEKNTLFSLKPGGLIRTNPDGNGFIDNHGLKYAADKWYHVLIVIDGQTKQGWMYDDDGNCVYSIRNDSSATRLSPFFIDTAFAKNLERLTLDNAKIVEYNPQDISPTVVTAPSVFGKSDVRANTAAAKVTFNIPLDTKSTAELISEDGTKTSCRIAPDPSKPYTYKIIFPVLEKDTDYTLNLKDVYSIGGRKIEEASSYSFSTVAAPIEFLFKTYTNDEVNIEKNVSGTLSYTGFNKGDTLTATLSAKKAATANILVLYFNSQQNDSLVKLQNIKSFIKKGTSKHTIVLKENVQADHARVFLWMP